MIRFDAREYFRWAFRLIFVSVFVQFGVRSFQFLNSSRLQIISVPVLVLVSDKSIGSAVIVVDETSTGLRACVCRLFSLSSTAESIIADSQLVGEELQLISTRQVDAAVA